MNEPIGNVEFYQILSQIDTFLRAFAFAIANGLPFTMQTDLIGLINT